MLQTNNYNMVRLILVSSAPLYSGRGTYTINLFRELKKMNLNVKLIWHQTPKPLLKHLRPLLSLLQSLSGKTYVVHFLTEGPSLIASLIPHFKKVVTLHNIPNRLHLKILDEFVDAFIVVGFNELQILKYEKLSKRVYYIPLGVLTDTFKPIHKGYARSVVGIKPGVIVLFTTDDDPRVRADKVIEVVYCLRKKYGLNAKLLILGRPSENTQKKIHDLGLEESAVKFVSGIPLSQLVYLYNSADLMLYLSTYDSFPLSVIEAAACGLPILSTPIGTVPLIMENMKELLIDENLETEEICDRVYTLLQDRDSLEKYAKLLRKESLKYSWKMTALKTIQVYLDILRS
uniref:Glycosyltransferase n=1 Tax=Ignisphaera aggregans TaxID=334771 RepID=A0A7C4FH11_9CREN